MSLQGKGSVCGSGHIPSPPLSPQVPVEGGGPGGAAGGGAELALEEQQADLLQEERILSQHIESLQKEKYALLFRLTLTLQYTNVPVNVPVMFASWTASIVCYLCCVLPVLCVTCAVCYLCREELTYEMLVLEPRASDDETEASCSSENLHAPSFGCGTYRSRKLDGKSRRTLKHQPDSVDSTSSVSSCISSSSYHPSSSLSSTVPPSPLYRVRSSSSGPLLSCSLATPLPAAEGDPRAVKSRLRLSRSSPRDEGRRRDAHLSSPPQQLVLYGSNEFMV